MKTRPSSFPKEPPMGKKEALAEVLRPLVKNRAALEKYIIENSALPGPRANLELAFACAEVLSDVTMLSEWTGISASVADVNQPRSFLPFCAAVSLGKIYTHDKDARIIPLLKKVAADRRWRLREAAAFGFQHIGEDDFNELAVIFRAWVVSSDNLEKRAILVSLAHPPMLNLNTTPFCFEIAETVLATMDRITDFDVLKKGLDFTISVFTEADPERGFAFIRKWMTHDTVIRKIMHGNLTKKRLSNKYPDKVAALLG